MPQESATLSWRPSSSTEEAIMHATRECHIILEAIEVNRGGHTVCYKRVPHYLGSHRAQQRRPYCMLQESATLSWRPSSSTEEAILHATRECNIILEAIELNRGGHTACYKRVQNYLGGHRAQQRRPYCMPQESATLSWRPSSSTEEAMLYATRECHIILEAIELNRGGHTVCYKRVPHYLGGHQAQQRMPYCMLQESATLSWRPSSSTEEAILHATRECHIILEAIELNRGGHTACHKRVPHYLGGHRAQQRRPYCMPQESATLSWRPSSSTEEAILHATRECNIILEAIELNRGGHNACHKRVPHYLGGHRAQQRRPYCMLQESAT